MSSTMSTQWTLNGLCKEAWLLLVSKRMLSGHSVVSVDLHEICRKLNCWSLNGPSRISGSLSTETTFWGVLENAERSGQVFSSLNGLRSVERGLKLAGNDDYSLLGTKRELGSSAAEFWAIWRQTIVTANSISNIGWSWLHVLLMQSHTLILSPYNYNLLQVCWH